MISLDKFRTPRWVWVNSAIAATLLHTILVWWSLAAWHTRQSTTTPAPISIVAIPENSIPEPTGAVANTDISASVTVASTETSADTSSAPVTPPPVVPSSQPATVPATPPLEAAPTSTPPVTPSGSSTPPTGASTPPVGSAISPVETATPPVGSATPPVGSSNPPAGSTPPVGAATPPGDSTVLPVGPGGNPGNEGSGGNGATLPGASALTGSVQSWWSLQPVPGGGSDIHDQAPSLPEGWQDSTSDLLARANCSSGLVAPGASVRLTLWPIVMADGQISEFAPWDEGNSGVPDAVMQCVQGLRSQMRPLIPAQDGGMPIASDEVLLVIEVRGTP